MHVYMSAIRWENCPSTRTRCWHHTRLEHAKGVCPSTYDQWKRILISRIIPEFSIVASMKTCVCLFTRIGKCRTNLARLFGCPRHVYIFIYIYICVYTRKGIWTQIFHEREHSGVRSEELYTFLKARRCLILRIPPVMCQHDTDIQTRVYTYVKMYKRSGPMEQEIPSLLYIKKEKIDLAARNGNTIFHAKHLVQRIWTLLR